MSNKKKLIIYSISVFILAIFLLLPLPYYIYKPGTADSLHSVVEVEGGFQSEGDLHLVTVRGGRATPLQFLLANFLPYQEVHRLADVFPEGYDRDMYLQAQLQLMESSQQAAMVVAYQAAGEPIEVHYEGVYVVSIIEGMPAESVLQIADKILEVNGEPVRDADHLIELVNSYEVGDVVRFLVSREEDQFVAEIELAPFPHQPDQYGIGIQLVTNREVNVERSVTFSSGKIGGPSAGLVLSLEMYNQLTEEDITHGLSIAGTGEIDYNGNVLRIGGVDKKVIAADRAKCDIFFVPNEHGAEDSNYVLAMETAERIGTDMEIIPIDTFEDALDYLAALDR
ncbi:SepM family pheromone-processing serine protease [Amphibacillus sediminis]|uniref:SepM family pheromone-processing serine protease n=1 Tax=Amphibacillus sediminis TaxID=360185 RepID=UPI0012ED2431|nr:SepM family pheromone-processing serine protease [Amphibacillus sediminis]